VRSRRAVHIYLRDAFGAREFLLERLQLLVV
jgi:hypothetical protein